MRADDRQADARGRGSDRGRRHGHAPDPVPAGGHLGRDPSDRLPALGRPQAGRARGGGRGGGPGGGRLRRGRHRAVRRPRRGRGAVGAGRRRARCGRRRQLGCLPDGSGRAARRARDQSAHRAVPAARDRRQPELHHADDDRRAGRAARRVRAARAGGLVVPGGERGRAGRRGDAAGPAVPGGRHRAGHQARGRTTGRGGRTPVRSRSRSRSTSYRGPVRCGRTAGRRRR